METALNPPRTGEGDHAQHGGGAPAVLVTPIKQVKRARRLRREMSLPEVLLWRVLRARPNGLKFRRQFPMGSITVDFACLERRLIIEVDGEWHGFGDQPRRDHARDVMLQRAEFRVLRIAARDILKDMNAVVQAIVAACSGADPLHQPAAGPPPRSGEE